MGTTGPDGSASAGPEQMYTSDQAAAILGLTPRGVRTLVAERRIRFVRIGKYVRIPASSLVELQAAGTVEAGSDG